MTPNPTRTLGVLAATAALAASAGLAGTAPAHAATVVHYQNCTQLVKKYPHGVRKAATVRNRYVTKGVTHYKATLATVDAKTYAANTKLDADRDGIACER